MKIELKCEDISYKVRMIEANRIPGILPVKVSEDDKGRKFIYDTGDFTVIKDVFRSVHIKSEEIRKIILRLAHILRDLDDYLMDETDILFDPGHIFVRYPDIDIALCLLPGNGTVFHTGLSEMLRMLLAAVNHEDHDSVLYAYTLYQESLQPGCDLKRLCAIDIKPGVVSEKIPRVAERQNTEISGKEVNLPEDENDDFSDMYELLKKTGVIKNEKTSGKKKFFFW